MSLLSTALVVVNAVLYPPFYLLSSVLLLLWTLVSPLISLGQGILSLILLPFRILAKFEAVFIFIAVAIVTGAVLGLTLHYTSTLTVEWVHQFMQSIAFPRRKDDSGEAVIKPKLEDQLQHYPQGAFEDDSLSDPTSSGDPFAEWNSKNVMKSPSGTQFMSTTILEEDEYSEDSAGH